MKRFTDLDMMVDDLLSRHETRAEAKRLLAYTGDFGSVAAEDAFVARLRSLEADGALVVKRKRADGVDKILHISLADSARLYAYRKRTPASEAALLAVGPARTVPGLPETADAVFDLIENAWSRNVAWCGLRPNQSVGLVASVRLALALGKLATSGGDFISVDYRTFSRRTTGDSKILERRIRLVVELFQRFFPESNGENSLDDADLLARLGVERFSQPLLLGGSIILDGTELPSTPFVGVPAEQVSRLAVARASHVLLVENYTSFVRHCREVNRSGDALVVYTGGFPARAVLGAILSLVAPLRCPVFHWGDIDRGGLLIFMHLERALARSNIALLPHLMTQDILERYGGSAGESLPAPPRIADQSAISRLWDYMATLSSPLELEQEELDPASPVRRSAQVSEALQR